MGIFGFGKKPNAIDSYEGKGDQLGPSPFSFQTNTELESVVRSTTQCHRFGHPEFEIRFSSRTVSQDVDWLLRFLENNVSGGSIFQDGETLQIGWMITRIEKAGDGKLRLKEPDMKVVPVQFVDSVTETLLHLRTQKDVVESLVPLVAPDFPSLLQSVVVHANFKTARRVLLSRGLVQDTDSGWWLSDLDDPEGAQDPARFLKTSLYQLGVDRPDLIKFFAVPSDLQVAIDGPHIGVIDASGELKQAPGSYLSELNRIRRGTAG
ncbi:immunity protein Imm33 domain-containing protein [Cupriavidus sp. YAF13]|uniref:immunity protein Imm33 domain-containing protein n=1 Tax=Cupriavidus sp. YAF13 TaxID=3233075 RepID=UPI003F915069